ncbi:MAG: hypothetical protein ACE3JP_04430 [Ectobacillus sp.]
MIFISRTSVHHGYADIATRTYLPSGFPLDEAELGLDRYDIRPGEKEGFTSTLTFNTDYFLG